MNKSAKRLTALLIIIASLIFIASAIFCFAVFNPQLLPSDLYEHFNSAFIDSEGVHVLLIFAVALLPAMLILAVSAVISLIPVARVRRRIKKKIERQSPDKSGIRFSRLSEIDRRQAADYKTKKKKNKKKKTVSDLSEVCERFRDYAAGELKLYYDIKDIRRFIAGMGISRLIILRGISGTGKTSLAYAAGEFFGNPSTVVPIQPMWKERSDMIGYFNEFTKRFNETSMLCKLYEAGGSKDVYITVLDEVNIARIEYYFAEFLSLLELPDPRRRYLDVVADVWESDPVRLVDGRLLLPINMWFVGTANNDDSTFSISDKVYDRAAIIDLDRKCEPFIPEKHPPCHISYADLIKLYIDAHKKHSISAEAQSKIIRLDEYMTEIFHLSFGNRIMKQIGSYIPIILACGGTEEDALDDIISRKLLRKLEQLSPAFVKSETDALCDLLDELFGEDSLPQCRSYITSLRRF